MNPQEEHAYHVRIFWYIAAITAALSLCAFVLGATVSVFVIGVWAGWNRKHFETGTVIAAANFCGVFVGIALNQLEFVWEAPTILIVICVCALLGSLIVHLIGDVAGYLPRKLVDWIKERRQIASWQ